MKVLTSELANIALDWAVATALGIETYGPEDFREQRKYTVKNGEYVYRWSSSRAQGGVILEDEGIDLIRERQPLDCGNGTVRLQPVGWRAQVGPSAVGMEPQFTQFGPTQLVAGLRCFISYKIGAEVEIPDVLLN